MTKYDATMKERLNLETEEIKELWVRINLERRARKMAQWLSSCRQSELGFHHPHSGRKATCNCGNRLLVNSTSFCWQQEYTWCAFYIQVKFIHVK